MYTHILIPTDGSPLAEKAVGKGIALAKALGASVTILTVIEPLDMMQRFATADRDKLEEVIRIYEREAEIQAGKVLEAAAAEAGAAGIAVKTLWVQSTYPYDAIIKTAEKNGVDLIVMSSHGRKGVAATLVGSETTKVLTYSKIPVLVLR